MGYFLEPISQYIWDLKYRYRKNNRFAETTIDSTWRRVAWAIAKAELPDDRKQWQQQFYHILENFRFLPGGRILAGAGTTRHVTLFNCFVMNIAEDSLNGIFDAVKEGAITLQQGGGVGYDFSVLRPHGQLAKHTGAVASGPVSFMQIWNSMAATIQSSGARRGAMMATLRCDHPDIEDFIRAKESHGQLSFFNLSVIITDKFIHAVKNDDEWPLVFPAKKSDKDNDNIMMQHWSGSDEPVACVIHRKVRARELWNKILRAAYEYGEPGVLFEDTINHLNPLYYCEWLSATNPCGEIPLPPYGACNLGSINLTQFVIEPYTEKASIDWHGIENTALIATRFLDNVVSVSKYPFTKQKQQVQATRRIGLGFCGLANMLVMLGIKYGSQQSFDISARVMKTIAYATWNASIELAKVRGVFTHFQKDKYLQGDFVQKLPEEIRRDIDLYGVRNSHHNAIAPTGTISFLANNISSGLEPIYSAQYQRKVRAQDNTLQEFLVQDYAYRLWQQKNPTEKFPPAWIDAQKLLPEEHLGMQAAVQPYIDNAISKTINIPVNFPFEALHDVYMKAHELGLKGCTIFRPNPVTGHILSTTEVEPCCPTQ